MSSPLLKVVVPLVNLMVVVAVVHFRRFSWRNDVGLKVPPASGWGWLVPWVLWIVEAESLGQQLGVAAVKPFEGLGPGGLAVMFVGMALLAPAGEELLFRGLLYGRLKATRLREPGAIVVLALFFAVIHLQYGWREWIFIFLDALLFGLVRWRTGSVLVPMVMHMIGNSIAWAQRLP